MYPRHGLDMYEDAPHQVGFRDDSYQVGGLADPAAELGRLERQARVARPLELGWLRGLELAEDARIADIGCGPGFMTEALATLVPNGSVVGVDTDRELIRQGRRRLAQQGPGRVRFVHASADLMPLEDGAVDLAYARFLFQHLPRPVEVMREMARVVGPGGRVVVVDTDDGGLVLHPTPEGFDSLVSASQAAQARRGGDRRVGRKLREMMHAAGLTSVRVDVVPFTTEMVGMATFLDICLGFKSHIIEDAELPAADVERALAAARSLVEDRDAFGHALGYVAVGTVA